MGDRYTRSWNVFGSALNIFGIGLVALGVYRICKFGGRII
jgi:hypothetical protein